VQLERGTTLRAAGGLPPVELRTLTLPDPLSPSTWTVQWQSGAASETASFSRVMRELQFPPRTFISVAQDNDGQHRFIRLEDVLAGMAPQLVSEAAVKQLPDALKLYARHAGGATAPAPVNTMAELPKEMAPHSFGSNYSVVPWIGLGGTRCVMLSDESTLVREPGVERILEHISLVVNCHEDACDLSKYRVGRKSGKPLEVLTHAVHRWYTRGSASVQVNDEIQRAIWSHLEQGGCVAVHCLAGIHRAACIVACHFLFRHYTLGHTEVPHDVKDIYRKLQSVRPAVSPAYEHVLQDYRAHVMKR